MMTFTRMSWGLAILALLFGIVRVLLGLSIATGYIGPYEVALSRYTTAASSGEVIDQGLFVILFAVVLGTISRDRLVLRQQIQRR